MKMFTRTVTLIALIDLYMWLHEMPNHFGTVVTVCVGLTVADIVIEKLIKL
jgi:hypothetical protein